MAIGKTCQGKCLARLVFKPESTTVTVVTAVFHWLAVSRNMAPIASGDSWELPAAIALHRRH